MNDTFLDFYRCPEMFATFTLAAALHTEPGYFRFGPDVICFGQCLSGHSCRFPDTGLHDSLKDISFNHASISLPFDLTQVIDNLRLERYAPAGNTRPIQRLIRDGYYFVRPLLGIRIRKHIQKLFFRDWDKLPFPRWPVDTTVEQLFQELMALALKSHRVNAIPFIWFWPDGASSCVTLTHDVETSVGASFCSKLMDIDDASGVKASFQIVPEERYQVTGQFLESIRQRGFELNIQDLNHDGLLFRDRKTFLARAGAINRYVRAYGSRGFRSAVMYRNPDWYEALDISYDLSIPNVAHLDPQRGGCCTVMPYFIGKILELPLTTTQDYTLFHILGDYAITLWVRQLEMIRQKNGLASFIIHPDYVIEKQAQNTYRALLAHISKLRSEGRIWVALPGEVDGWWRERSQMKLVREDGKWVIEGAGNERASVAFATLEDGAVKYSIVDSCARDSCARDPTKELTVA